MAREPHFPEDTPVANQAGEAHGAAAAANSVGKKHLIKAGVAVGIGSAAIVAALLYANRSAKKDR
jgi:hypothetical protein